jgi:hypothetical protein
VSAQDKPGKLALLSLIGDVGRVYARHWRLLIPLAVVILLPQAVADAAIDEIDVAELGGRHLAETLGLGAALIVVNLFGEAFYAGAVAAAVLEWRAGSGLPGIRTLARALPYRRLIGADLILTAGTVLGLLLLIAPGIAFITYFTITPALIKIERLSVREAMRRSVELVKGNFWRVLAIVCLAIFGSEALAAPLEQLLHAFHLDLVTNLLAEALVEPFEGLFTVLTALALIELHGGLEPAQLGMHRGPGSPAARAP